MSQERATPPIPEHDAVEPIRRAALYLTIASVTIASAMVIGSGIAIDSDGVAPVAFIIAAMMTVSRLCNSRSRFQRFGDCLGALGQMWFAGLASGVIAIMGLHAHLPLVDGSLLATDQALGFDGLRIVAWFAAQPKWVLTVLSDSYFSTIPLLYLGLVILAVLGERLEVWRATLCFIGTVLTTCLISIVTPAKGLGVWIAPDLIARLPKRSIRHFWPAFEKFYGGAHPVLELNSIGGVVSFPSFHTIMGLIFVAMWRRHRLLIFPALAYFLVMLAATLPFGGHYAVDLLAGTAVWGAWFSLSRRLEQRATLQLATSGVAISPNPTAE